MLIRADSVHQLYVSDDRRLVTDETTSYCIHVNSASADRPLKVTLVWTDYPASVLSRTALVNNLDLFIVWIHPVSAVTVQVDATGRLFGAPDSVNVFEQISLTAVTPGMQGRVTILHFFL